MPLVGCAELQGKAGDVGGEVPCQRRRRGEQENVCDGLVEMTRLRLRLVVRERGREGERERGGERQEEGEGGKSERGKEEKRGGGREGEMERGRKEGGGRWEGGVAGGREGGAGGRILT